jgi:hypothetical protein
VFDGRNIYEPELLRTLGLGYYAIGRGDGVNNGGLAYGRRKTDKITSKAS